MRVILVAASKLRSDLKSLVNKAGVKMFVTKTPDMGAVSETIRQMIEKN